MSETHGQEAGIPEREGKMAVDEGKRYDCTICPYPGYRDKKIIFCDVCFRRILEELEEKKQRKEFANEGRN
jgi:hypothetical protein